ncbi:MAG: two-component regulator propeller domain-containing protein [Arenimonas sp.]
MHRLKVLFALALILLSIPVFALDKKPLPSYSREAWTTRDGLPHNQVNAITQTPEGYLWFATWEGLVRYNGQDFRIFTPENIPALQDHGIRHVSVGSHGKLIVSTSRGGVSVLQKDLWRTYSMSEGLPQNETMASIEDSQGSIWVSHESKGLSRIDLKGKVTTYGTRQGLPSERMYAVFMDENKVIWAGTAKGLVRIENNRVQSFSTADGLPAGAVYAILAAPEGGLYLGTHHGLYLGRNGKFKIIAPDFPDEAVISLSLDSETNLWLGTVNRGVMRFGRRGLETLDAKAGLPNNRVGSLFSDREGNIWAGTNAGLVRFADTPFVTYDNYQGLSDNYVRAVAQTNDGSVMIGTSRGLNKYYDEKITPIIDSPTLRDDAILSLAPAKDGSLWVGMYSTGLVNWKDGVVREQVTPSSPLYGTQVRALLEDSKGYLWVGTSQGLYRKKGSELKRFGEANGLPRDFILSIHESKAGKIWVGTANGLGYVDGEKAGSVDISTYQSAQDVFGFNEDADGTLWLATDRAILRLRKGKISAVGTKNGLPVATVFQIVSDTYGNFWLTSNRGVIYVKRNEMEAVADGKSERLNAISFAEADGMASAQCNGGAGPAALRAKDGSIWVATAKGLSVVQPDELARYQLAPPPVVIENVMVNDQIADPDSELILPSDTRKLEMAYVSLSYRTPEQIRYRYQLEGFDEEWIEREQLRNVQFTNLPPGRYTFKVSAAQRGGPWSPESASLKFEIKPRLFQRPWFIPLVVFLLAMILYGLYRARVRQLEARELELSGIVDERTRALSDKNVELEMLNMKISQQSEAFEQQARTDSLTGLPNRRSMDEKLLDAFKTAVSSEQPLCFGLLDVDHFKQVNDNYSHDVGDHALKVIAETLQRVMGEEHFGRWRGSDLSARWGGEEFALLFPEQDLESARLKCEKIRLAIQAIDCNSFAPGLKLTVSIGLSERTGLSHHEKLASKADVKLYEAKRNGRNQVVG